MKNKLSRFAVPYEVWMAIFVVAPIVIMVAYAFSSADGGFTLDNFVQMGGLYGGVSPVLQAGHHRHGDLSAHRLPGVLSHEPGGRLLSADGHGAHYAAHVDELPAADLFVDDHSGKQRTF